MKLFTSKFIRIITFLAVIFSLGFNISQVNATNPVPPSITTIDSILERSLDVKSQELGIARTQKININTNAVDQIAKNLTGGKNEKHSARFQVFGDLAFDATFEKIEETIQAGYILTGKLNDDPDSFITLVSTDGIISANLEYHGKQYHLKSNEQGVYQFDEIDQSQFPEELDAIPNAPDTSETFSDLLQDTTALDSGYVIDVMVVYTTAARIGAGNTANMQNLINLAVSETNTGYLRSGVFSSMRLVHTAEVNYDEAILTSSSGWGTALSQLTNQDNVIDEVRNLRNTYAADLVVMIVNNTTYCGIGWLMTPNYTNDSVGYSVVSRVCATGYYSFAHETGHNMGAHHDRASAGGGTAMYSYSYGYQAPDSSFRTIMAYNCTSGCPRINNWSNPEVLYNGKPTGVSSTASNSADNRLTLNNTASIVTNFRASMTPPTAPSNLAVQQVKSSDITFGFFDNSINEQGFKVERSINGGTWSLLSTLPANTTSFIDQSLVCDTTYAYKVYAYNQYGNSAYSNISSFSCAPPEPITDIKVFSTVSSITLNWSPGTINTTYIIELLDDQTKSLSLDQGLEISELPYTLSGLQRDTTYTIKITSINEFGTLENDPITVKTLPFAIYLPLTQKQ